MWAFCFSSLVEYNSPLISENGTWVTELPILDMLWFVQLYLFLEVDTRPVMDHLLWRTKLKVNGVMLHELW